MSSLSLGFSLRTSLSCKTVHLLGSWDGYQGQLPLSKESSRSGNWRGTFKFPSKTLQSGERYWYYYVMDGYNASHDPTRPSTREPTTGRELNILEIPGSTSSKSASHSSSSHSSSRHSSSRHSSSHSSNQSSNHASSHSSSRYPSSSYLTSTRSAGNSSYRSRSRDVTKGRALSPSSIQSPRPYKPNETRRITSRDYHGHTTYDDLAERFAAATLGRIESDSDSDIDSDVPSLGSYGSSSRSSSTGYSSATSPSLSGSTSPSSLGSCCRCDRFGLTRKGDRVRIDCGGSRCGSGSEKSYSDGGSSPSCSSDSETEQYRISTTRRHATVVRAPRRR